MQFSLIVAILAALVISESAPRLPTSDVGYRVLGAVAAMACVVLVAVVGSVRIARRLEWDLSGRPRLLRRFHRLRQVHTALWLVAVGTILYGLDWSRIVRYNWRLNGIPLLDELLILAPVLVPVVLSWAAFYEVERVLQVLATLHERSAPPTTRRQYVILQARHWLGIVLLPVLGLAAVQDAAELLAPTWTRSEYALAIYAVPFVALLTLFPTLLRYVWQTWPLAAGQLYDRLHAAARRAGFRFRSILVWNTHGMLVNAAVAGFFPPLRYVFLTDGLLSHLTDAEIEAVFGHEVGHIRHRHLPLRIVAMVAPISAGVLLDQAFPQAGQWLQHRMLEGGLPAQIPLGLLALGAMAVYGLVVFGSYSRLLEGQADLYGCRSLDAHEDIPAVETFVSALEKLAIFGGIDRNASSWQHASVARRVAFLHRAMEDPQYERRFHQRVLLVSGFLLAVAISPVLWLLAA